MDTELAIIFANVWKRFTNLNFKTQFDDGNGFDLCDVGIRVTDENRESIIQLCENLQTTLFPLCPKDIWLSIELVEPPRTEKNTYIGISIWVNGA